MQIKFYITWNEIEQYVANICNKIGDKQYDCIVCPGRGAMIPTRLIAGKLGISNIKYINIRSYINNAKHDHITENIIDNLEEYSRILIVDDCISTGGTIENVQRLFHNSQVDVAVLLKNIVISDSDTLYYSEVFDQEKTWIVFPWEINDK